MLLSNTKEQITDATTWLNLRNIVSERSLMPKKRTYKGFHSYDILEQIKPIYGGKRSEKGLLLQMGIEWEGT